MNENDYDQDIQENQKQVIIMLVMFITYYFILIPRPFEIEPSTSRIYFNNTHSGQCNLLTADEFALIEAKLLLVATLCTLGGIHYQRLGYVLADAKRGVARLSFRVLDWLAPTTDDNVANNLQQEEDRRMVLAPR